MLSRAMSPENSFPLIPVKPICKRSVISKLTLISQVKHKFLFSGFVLPFKRYSFLSPFLSFSYFFTFSFFMNSFILLMFPVFCSNFTFIFYSIFIYTKIKCTNVDIPCLHSANQLGLVQITTCLSVVQSLSRLL